jgi:prepilin-type N-terminal cleavage/methylation domain-containing protein
MKRTRRNGFTLIEVLAVVFLTAILFGAAVNYYVELSTRSNQAAETTRQWRHATALLDRVAADLERAYLVRKPEERDPLDHPWLFLAETRYAEEGADRIKFTSRRRVDLSTDGPRSDLAFVSYMLRTSEGWEDEDDAQYELLRWSQPGLPTELDRDFPHPDDSQLVADGIAAFQLRFQDDQGTWHEGWDAPSPGPPRSRSPLRPRKLEKTHWCQRCAGASPSPCPPSTSRPWQTRSPTTGAARTVRPGRATRTTT